MKSVITLPRFITLCGGPIYMNPGIQAMRQLYFSYILSEYSKFKPRNENNYKNKNKSNKIN